jgi:hypothetical protein
VEAGGGTLQERLESSPPGRAAISALLAVVVLSILLSQLPASRLREQGMRAAGPVLNAAGLDQDWGMFAPEPRSQVLQLYARVTFDDGTSRDWYLRPDDPVVGAYWDYRWLKWVELVTRDDHPGLWKPFASWVARRVSGPGREPVHVELHRRFRQIRPPGAAGPSRGPWRDVRYYTVRGR